MFVFTGGEGIKSKYYERIGGLVEGFPIAIQDDIFAVLNVIPQDSHINPCVSYNAPAYLLGDGEIQFPHRVYFFEPTENRIKSLTRTQQTILNCIYSRSHNGFIRQKHINALLSIDFPEWAIPYIIKICDEYVIEILHDVYENLKDKNTEHVKQFCANNHTLFCLSYNRMISYWNEFYRKRNGCYKFEHYIGRKLFIKCFGAKRKMNYSKKV